MRKTLDTLFQKLDQKQISYCLLRDADQLERITPKMEIDLLVDPQKINIMQDLMVELGFIKLTDWGYHPHHFFINYDEENDCWLKLDVVTQVSFGKPVPSLHTPLAAKCLKDRQRTGSIYTPPPVEEFIAMLLHCLLDKGIFTPARRQRIRVLLDRITEDRHLTHKLTSYFPDQKNWSKIENLLRKEEWDELLADRQIVSDYMFHGNKFSTATYEIWFLALRKLNRIRRFIHPLAPSLALLAPDGAGKSTLANHLKTAFYFPVTTIYMGLYQKQIKIVKDKRWPGNILIVKLLKVWQNYLKARYHQARGHLIIFDRFIYDALLPSQHPLSPIKQISRWLISHSCPHPDLVILLDAPGDVLFQRKGEHSPSFLEHQRQAYYALRQQLPRMITIDATQAVEVSQQKITSLVWRLIQGKQIGKNYNQIVREWIDRSNVVTNEYSLYIESSAEIPR